MVELVLVAAAPGDFHHHRDDRRRTHLAHTTRCRRGPRSESTPGPRHESGHTVLSIGHAQPPSTRVQGLLPLPLLAQASARGDLDSPLSSLAVPSVVAVTARAALNLVGMVGGVGSVEAGDGSLVENPDTGHFVVVVFVLPLAHTMIVLRAGAAPNRAVWRSRAAKRR